MGLVIAAAIVTLQGCTPSSGVAPRGKGMMNCSPHPLLYRSLLAIAWRPLVRRAQERNQLRILCPKDTIQPSLMSGHALLDDGRRIAE